MAVEETRYNHVRKFEDEFQERRFSIVGYSATVVGIEMLRSKQEEVKKKLGKEL